MYIMTNIERGASSRTDSVSKALKMYKCQNKNKTSNTGCCKSTKTLRVVGIKSSCVDVKSEYCEIEIAGFSRTELVVMLCVCAVADLDWIKGEVSHSGERLLILTSLPLHSVITG